MKLRKIARIICMGGLCCAAALGTPARAAETSTEAQKNWPQWRGPNLNGTSNATNLPTSWSETENIVWKTALPWWSGSTPIVWGDRIFLTSPEKSAKAAPEPGRGRRARGGRDPGGTRLVLLCLDRADGSVIWQREVGSGNRLLRKQNMASPSPVTDGEHVWVMTGTGLLRGFDFDGNEIWRRDIQKDYGQFGLNWGYASSPLLHDDRLIVPVLHGMRTDDPSYLLAIDKATGKTIWRTERPTDAIFESPDSYATPQLLQYDGNVEIVINGGDIVTGHDMSSGRELWRANVLNPRNNRAYRIIASSVVVDGWVYAPSRKNPLVAIQAGGRGDISKSHVKWQTRWGPDVPTPVSNGTYIWIVDDGGVTVCLDAKTGAESYEPRRIARGTYSASLVLADGKIFATNEQAVTTVLSATPEFNVLSTNTLDDPYTLSSPAIADSQIFIRTSTHLYCIAKKSAD